MEAPFQERGRVVALVVRRGGGKHEQPDGVELSVERGLVGDRWYEGARRKSHQVSMASVAALEQVAGGRAEMSEAGDNLIVDMDLSFAALPAGTLLEVGTARLRVTDAPHLGCKKFATRFGDAALAWVNAPEGVALRRRGVYCEVVRSGRVHVGDIVAAAAEAD